MLGARVGEVGGATAPSRALASARAARLEAMAAECFQFIWRSLRRLGVPAEAVDDAAQQVFVVAATKIDAIEPGRERAYLYMTAVRVAADARKAAARRREIALPEALDARADALPGPEQALSDERDRALLDAVLDALPIDLRTVFTLFELEDMTTAEIAALLELPAGTVASRLRRAREEFQATARRLTARAHTTGPNAASTAPRGQR
jgi:RNA polymerase sigma-70 factor (ECF subfamily)